MWFKANDRDAAGMPKQPVEKAARRGERRGASRPRPVRENYGKTTGETPVGRMGGTPTPRSRPFSTGGKGFTLIEMLVVIVIIGLLVSMIVGVSMWIYTEASRKTTQGYQGAIVAAIETYYNVQHAYPLENFPPATTRSNALYLQLTAVPQSADKVRALPREAVSGAGEFLDAWGNLMDYRLLGGRPVLISHGPDKIVNDSASPDARKDNIRSDGQ